MQKFYLLSNRIIFYLLIFLVFFIPLYPKFPLLNIPGTFVAIRLEDMLIGFTLGIWLISNASKFRKYLSQTIFQVFLAFFLIAGLSVMSAIIVTYFVQPHLALLHWVRRIEYMSIFFIAATSIRSEIQVKQIIKIMLVVSALVVLYGFGQIWFDFPVISTTNREFSKGLILYLTNNARVNSTFAGHYDLAVYLSIILMIIPSLFFYTKKYYEKISLTFLGIACFALLGLTAARVSFVATILGLVLVFWLNNKKLLVVGVIFLSMALVVVIPELRHRLVATITVNLLEGGGPKYNPPAGTVTIFTPERSLPEASREALLEKAKKEATSPSSTKKTIPVDTVPGEPTNPTELGVYRSFGIRFNVEWPRALNAFYKNPLLGTGYSSISLATDNDFLRALGETGLLGFVSLTLIFYLIIKSELRFIAANFGYGKFIVTGIVCAITVVLISGLFIDVLEASKIAGTLWLLLGVSWAIVDGYKLNNNE